MELHFADKIIYARRRQTGANQCHQCIQPSNDYQNNYTLKSMAKSPFPPSVNVTVNPVPRPYHEGVIIRIIFCRDLPPKPTRFTL